MWERKENKKKKCWKFEEHPKNLDFYGSSLSIFNKITKIPLIMSFVFFIPFMQYFYFFNTKTRSIRV